MTPRRLWILDTTLRDGEQAPGASLGCAAKISIARDLEELGVDIVEAGFPASSAAEFKAVTAIGLELKHCRVAALCRAVADDITAAAEALIHAGEPRLHVFIPTSDLHLKQKLKISRGRALELVAESVGLASRLCPDVEFSAEDATRSDPGFLDDVIQCAVRAGAKVVNLPDTVGIATPEEYRGLIERAIARCEQKAAVSAHCHDDLGLATANTLAAILAGAEQVECTINGIGERAGMAALEEILAALAVRSELFGVATGIRTRHLLGLSRKVSEATGFPVPPNKAVVGRNAFAHQSGIHQHGVINDPATYEIMKPSEFGTPDSSLVIGKHSGRRAMRERLDRLGGKVDDACLAWILEKLKSEGEERHEWSDEDLRSLCSAWHGMRRGRRIEEGGEHG